jgi:hypothetical protein
LLVPALVSPAHADPAVDTVIEPVLMPEMATIEVQIPGPPGFDLSICNATFKNQLNFLAFYSQNGMELMDDLHTATHGTEMLCAYQIGFYNLSFSQTDAWVTIYDNDAADGLPGKILAGPFHVLGLPGGLVRATFAADWGVVDSDVWMGVRFGAFRSTGLQAADPVMIGSSHDIAYSPRYGYVSFGGAGHLPTNFVLGISSQPPVPVLSRTWGDLKATYR